MYRFFSFSNVPALALIQTWYTSLYMAYKSAGHKKNPKKTQCTKPMSIKSKKRGKCPFPHFVLVVIDTQISKDPVCLIKVVSE